VFGQGQNDGAQLGLGDGQNRRLPTLIPTKNVIYVACGQESSYYLTTCPHGTSGPQCQYPVCYGQSALDTQYTCSGQGNCSFLDNCVCRQVMGNNVSSMSTTGKVVPVLGQMF
jgi:hypothetical protein